MTAEQPLTFSKADGAWQSAHSSARVGAVPKTTSESMLAAHSPDPAIRVAPANSDSNSDDDLSITAPLSVPLRNKALLNWKFYQITDRGTICRPPENWRLKIR